MRSFQSLNAILIPILLILVLILANDKRIMGTWKNTKLSNVLGVLITLLITVTTIALLAPFLKAG